MMELVDMIGWAGTAFMFGGSVLSIYKHKACWPLWIIGGLAIIIQCVSTSSWNLVVMQILYMPLNLWGWMQWKIDDER
jgi:hypothetical protein